MRSYIWKTEAGRQRLNAYYDKFTAKVDGEVEFVKAETRFGETNVLVSGPENGSPLICLHAMRTGAPFIVSELNGLLEGYRIFAPDIPGQSVRGIDTRLSVRDDSYADWLVDVMDGLAIDSANVFGVSWGGFVARLTATFSPDRISKLGLMVPAGIANGSHLTGLAKMAVPLVRYKLWPTESNLKSLLAPIFTTWDSDWADFFEISLRDWRFDTRVPPLASDQELAGLSMPTLVLAADDDISFPGAKVIDRLESLVPHVESELMPDCKHCPPTTDSFRAYLAKRLSQFYQPTHESSD